MGCTVPVGNPSHRRRLTRFSAGQVTKRIDAAPLGILWATVRPGRCYREVVASVLNPMINHDNGFGNVIVAPRLVRLTYGTALPEREG